MAAATPAPGIIMELSTYASVEIVAGHQEASVRVLLHKKPYGKERVTATLLVSEWEALSQFLPMVKQTSEQMLQCIQRGENPFLQRLQRVLSDNYCATLNAFETASDGMFVTLSIRRYFTSDAGLCQKKSGGVTINLEEINTLINQAPLISREVTSQLNNTKIIHLQSATDVENARKLVSDFWAMGTGQCRITLKKEVLPSYDEDDDSSSTEENLQIST